VVLTGCHKAARQLAATINNRPITYAEIDRIYDAQFSATAERPATTSWPSRR